MAASCTQHTGPYVVANLQPRPTHLPAHPKAILYYANTNDVWQKACYAIRQSIKKGQYRTFCGIVEFVKAQSLSDLPPLFLQGQHPLEVPINIIILNGDFRFYKLFLENVDFGLCPTLLHELVRSKRIQWIKSSFNSNPNSFAKNINSKDLNGDTPYTLATKLNDAKSARYLLRCGADYRVPDANNQTARKIASLNSGFFRRELGKITELAEYGHFMLEAPYQTPALKEQRTAEVFKRLALKFYDPESKACSSSTLRGDVKKFILYHGIDLTAEDSNGCSLLIAALNNPYYTNNLYVARWLVKLNEINFANANEKGETAYYLAARLAGNITQDSVTLFAKRNLKIIEGCKTAQQWTEEQVEAAFQVHELDGTSSSTAWLTSSSYWAVFPKSEIK